MNDFFTMGSDPIVLTPLYLVPFSGMRCGIVGFLLDNNAKLTQNS